MKRLITGLLCVVGLLTISTAEAQLRFGIRAGVNVSDLSFSKDIMKSSNVAGFTGGVMAEFMIPGLGVGVDGALMYSRHGSKLKFKDVTEIAGNVVGLGNSKTQKLDYIEIPLNLKYKFTLPIVKPYLFIGPSFAFLVGNNISEEFKKRKFDTSINLGAGLELLNKVQVSVQYGWGLNKTLRFSDDATTINAKNRFWTITAAYLF